MHNLISQGQRLTHVLCADYKNHAPQGKYKTSTEEIEYVLFNGKYIPKSQIPNTHYDRVNMECWCLFKTNKDERRKYSLVEDMEYE